MEILALLPLIWLMFWLGEKMSKTKSRPSDKHVRIESPVIKEIDEDIMLAVIVRNERTGGMCAAVKDTRNDGEIKYKESRNIEKLEQFIRDEYEKTKNKEK